MHSNYISIILLFVSIMLLSTSCDKVTVTQVIDEKDSFIGNWKSIEKSENCNEYDCPSYVFLNLSEDGYGYFALDLIWDIDSSYQQGVFGSNWSRKDSLITISQVDDALGADDFAFIQVEKFDDQSFNAIIEWNTDTYYFDFPPFDYNLIKTIDTLSFIRRN